MQSLLYPAFLGTCIVFFVQSLFASNAPNLFECLYVPLLSLPSAQQISPSYLAYSYAPLLLIYFAILFVETQTTHDASYRTWTFLVDCCEITLMVLAFNALGFFAAASIAPRSPAWPFWLSLLLLFLLPFVWRSLMFVGGFTIGTLNTLCWLASAACLEKLAARRLSIPSLEISDMCMLRFHWLLLVAYLVFVILRGFGTVAQQTPKLRASGAAR